MSDYITSREQTTAEYYLRWAVQNCSKRGYVKLPCDKVLEIAEYIESTRDEVVRCKDCKKYNTDDCMMIHGKKMNRNIFANDFCSYGERAEQ